MRVTIEHREATSGVIANHKDCYVDCTVEFNEEERAIIKARDLYRDGFTVRAATPLPSTTQFYGTNILRTGGRLLLTGGIVYMVYSSFTHPATEPLGGLLFIVGAALEIYGWLRSRWEDKRIDTSEQEITVKGLLANPRFTVHAWNPAAAKGIEQGIRDDLAALKNLIADSADIRAKQSFEL
jgi:hypothetical protein